MTLEAIIIRGFATGGLSSLIRKASPSSWKSRPPVSCNACLSTWVALGFVFADLWVYGGRITKLPLEYLMYWWAISAIGGFLLAHILPPPFEAEIPAEYQEPSLTVLDRNDSRTTQKGTEP